MPELYANHSQRIQKLLNDINVTVNPFGYGPSMIPSVFDLFAGVSNVRDLYTQRTCETYPNRPMYLYTEMSLEEFEKKFHTKGTHPEIIQAKKDPNSAVVSLCKELCAVWRGSHPRKMPTPWIIWDACDPRGSYIRYGEEP